MALAIAAIALAAVSRSAAVSSTSAAEIKLRALAGFVAENRLGELDARRAWPPVGVTQGTERQAGIDFPWRMEVFATQHPLLRRVEVQVVDPAEPTHVLRTLVGILPKES
ncbi:MAG TPA: type II secretion system minor pseudopilin GspI [Burkholderiales bacterium]